MKEWQQYYEDTEKTRLLNVISLEFSHTKLDNYIQSPAIVREIDWVDVVWPRQLKEAQVEGTNSLDDMMYPKVQKYCLMSVKNCFTDFHGEFIHSFEITNKILAHKSKLIDAFICSWFWRHIRLVSHSKG